MQTDEEQPVYTMQVAANLLGAHPQTLRNYERAGLIRPLRTTGNQRLYSRAEIRRLRVMLRLVGRYELTMTSLGLIDQLHDGLRQIDQRLAGPPREEDWTEARRTVALLLSLLREETEGDE